MNSENCIPITAWSTPIPSADDTLHFLPMQPLLVNYHSHSCYFMRSDGTTELVEAFWTFYESRELGFNTKGEKTQFNVTKYKKEDMLEGKNKP